MDLFVAFSFFFFVLFRSERRRQSERADVMRSPFTVSQGKWTRRYEVRHVLHLLFKRFVMNNVVLIFISFWASLVFFFCCALMKNEFLFCPNSFYFHRSNFIANAVPSFVLFFFSFFSPFSFSLCIYNLVKQSRTPTIESFLRVRWFLLVPISTLRSSWIRFDSISRYCLEWRKLEDENIENKTNFFFFVRDYGTAICTWTSSYIIDVVQELRCIECMITQNES